MVTRALTVTNGRLPVVAVQTVERHLIRIKALVRMESATLTAACERAGMPADIAEVCAGMLASVVDDLIEIGRLPRTDWNRTKRKQRIIAACEDPQASALRLAMAASPVNGRAAVAHWDVVCEQSEVGQFAWLLGVDSENAWRYGKRYERRAAQ